MNNYLKALLKTLLFLVVLILSAAFAIVAGLPQNIILVLFIFVLLSWWVRVLVKAEKERSDIAIYLAQAAVANAVVVLLYVIFKVTSVLIYFVVLLIVYAIGFWLKKKFFG